MKKDMERCVFSLLLWGKPCHFKDFCSNHITSMLEEVYFSRMVLILGSVRVVSPEDCRKQRFGRTLLSFHIKDKGIFL